MTEQRRFSIQQLKPFLIALALLVPLFLAVFIRLQPINLPFAEDLAEQNVDNYYLQNIQGRINSQYPLMPEAERSRLVQTELERLKSENSAMYESQVDQLASNLRDAFQDETGRTYILAIDAYHYLRYVRNVMEEGHVYDELRNGEPYDTYMVAPIGRRMGTTGYLHAYFSAYLTKIIQGLGFSEHSYKDVFFVVPVIVAGAAVVSLFFLLYKTIGGTGAFLGTLYLAVSPLFLGRTIGGFSDTDAYTIFFPLLIGSFIVYAIFSEKKYTAALFGALTAIGFGLFAQAWTGWWYAMLVYGATVAVYLLIILLKGNIKTIKENVRNNLDFSTNKQLRNIVFGGGAFVVTFVLLGLTVFDTSILLKPLQAPINYLSIKEAARPDLWPNVYTTVAELGSISLSRIIQTLGGQIFLLFAFLSTGGLLFLLYKLFTSHDQGEATLKEHPLFNKGRIIFTALLGIIWLIGTYFTALRGGIRFSMLIVPAYAIMIGLSSYFIIHLSTLLFSRVGEMDEKISRQISIAVVIVLILLIIRPSYSSAVAQAESQRPMMTDAWNAALTTIDQDAPKEAIINSWWDFGHWFKAIGNRPVTFDGASQNSPQAHWIGKVLQTDDPVLAKGILRMLDCGANTAFDQLTDNHSLRQIDAITLLYDIIPESRERAQSILESTPVTSFSDQEISALLSKTHCQAPANYFITSGDMVGKAGVWSHFGLWNFTKADIWAQSQIRMDAELLDYMENEHSISGTQATTLLTEISRIDTQQEASSWISPFPSYGGQIPCQTINESTPSVLSCQQLQVNLETNEVVVPTNTGAAGRPVSFVYLANNTLKEKTYDEPYAIPYSIVLNEQNGEYSLVVADSKLATSMFTRLYYLDGKGQDVFTKFTQEQNIDGGKIIVWETIW